VPWAQGEDSMQGGDALSARRGGEQVAVAVRGQRGGAAPACRRGARELLLEDVQVSVEPGVCLGVIGLASEPEERAVKQNKTAAMMNGSYLKIFFRACMCGMDDG